MSLRVTFDAMAFGGDAIARHEGKAIFVPFAMPGDEAEIEIVEDRGRFARGKLLRVITPARERIVPRCKHFGVCGGCHWQHVAYAQQLDYKTLIVREQLTRIGGLSEPRVHATLGMDEPWHYRNHIQFHLTPDGRLGFMAARTNRVIPIEECHILEAPVESLWRALELGLPDLYEVGLRAGVHTDERMAIFRLDSDEAPEAEIDLPVNAVVQLSDGAELVLAGAEHFLERLGAQTFQVSASSFFQVNTRQAERLLALVRERLQLRGAETVLDAYCGVGTFALAVAPYAQRVVGIESAPSAVRDARSNAQSFANVEILEGSVETVLPPLTEKLDVVILDPPREGCAPAVLEAIARQRVPRIIYVSCDPSTLARDVKRLGEQGYRFVDAQPLDMFPQTFHIETIAELQLN